VVFGLVAGDQLNAGQVLEIFRTQFGVAAGDDQAGVRVAAVQSAQCLARFLGSDVGHGAGIEDTQVCLPRRGDNLVPGRGQLAGQAIHFTLVELAT
jgi:hypothetical protein